MGPAPPSWVGQTLEMKNYSCTRKRPLYSWGSNPRPGHVPTRLGTARVGLHSTFLGVFVVPLQQPLGMSPVGLHFIFLGVLVVSLQQRWPFTRSLHKLSPDVSGTCVKRVKCRPGIEPRWAHTGRETVLRGPGGPTSAPGIGKVGRPCS